MHEEFQILKVPDITEYKLSKLILSLLKDSPGFQKVYISLSSQQKESTPATQEISTKIIVRERKDRSENDNLCTNHHKNGIINQNI